MTDFDWYDPDVVEVAVDGLREESKKWFGLADRMTVVASQARLLALDSVAFAVTDVSGRATAADLQAGYEAMHSWLSRLFGEASDQFDAMAVALSSNADEYENGDNTSAKTFDDIATNASWRRTA
ncbi:hypothetical protein GCM10010168_34580 [Actinoplanes ianthinogenes]|uniref:Excreted virulence factor EspC (Type VII ESX diderm) n=1 Tax=Actinoplanes ianthinogenes TaxID=122358 RepID=A0ABM7M5V4_9ACTN|nr:hypothetical protein [Actinoplanes ianthinogenes]BCJ47022.1 hypothetical protein Aiant_76790 [Actinoplanes ianthinogenes]GGR13865.1 hypothetical protein GCM10010168_34580 [Actinoplanes ianthinogenes]